MKLESTTVRKALVALIAGIGLVAAAPSFADTAQNSSPEAGGYGPGYYGMGPGMMGGYGPGYHMGPGARRGYGPGYGMGPGYMGGYGGGYGPGYGMGPWMMGRYGMWPGMMGGYGMGPGMMWGGNGPYGMGPGMMWGGRYGGYGYNALDLTDAQRQKIEKIQEEAWNSQWEVMNKMHEAISQTWVEAQKKIDAVLTKKQREELKRGWGGQ